ncbi:HigA family addiction module antidote protein [Mobiluncus mulieris]|uniref:HigA family addiction module antidote protein n=2 Tax=Mobiluncus mulieris TaxID=2052 RepID=A0A7Y0UT71_9ACTO|nr:HigA family addiction module antidote protein [Mobiluncus mulieris]NMX02168.1 HigA family addiction module antidote protein [Mobiluncus mulieris]NMX03287.1 HigA family addiction module antidote protein [Mobiluncus mulieris]NMX11703.1 HigA family addiction module antidote protein [Mobiluncus mulieris]NMX20658.1 HigA family addiction module antidote protein [Mobiluncus mulieris]
MKNPVYPGAVIREDFLRELGISVTTASQKLGVSRVALSRVLNGKAALTPNLALRLELAGIGNAKLWLDMQTTYDLARARQTEPPQVEPLIAV